MGGRISVLRDHIKDKNLDKFVILYKEEDQHEICSDNHTLLSYAVSCSSEAIITFLLSKRSIDVCRAGCDEKTPLYVAVEKENLRYVMSLIEHGAQPTIQTSFLKAIQVENLQIVKYLHENGALVNFNYNNKSSPLTAAVKTGNVPLATYLANKGAKWERLSEEDKNLCLAEVVQSQHFDMLGFIVGNLKVNLNKQITDDYNLLTLSIEKDNLKMMKSLLTYGANVNAFDKKKRFPLALAISKNQLHAAVHLVKSGADINLAQQEVEAYAKKNDNFRAFLDRAKENTSRFEDIKNPYGTLANFSK